MNSIIIRVLKATMQQIRLATFAGRIGSNLKPLKPMTAKYVLNRQWSIDCIKKKFLSLQHVSHPYEMSL
jgi:hypothetical protein